MNYTLENNDLKATFKTSGAELCALEDKACNNYIWHGEPEICGR